MVRMPDDAVAPPVAPRPSVVGRPRHADASERPWAARARGDGPLAVALVATLVPVWYAAVRVAASGFFPTSDAALTVARARDVFTSSPPLVGMPAASGTFGDVVTHFPGPWHLWALSVPTRLLGNVWGPPLTMGLLSTCWILLVAWVLRRTMGTPVAAAAVALLGVFAWSIGIGHLVDPVPVLMIIFPMLAFLLLAWAATTGEPAALVAAAVLANFLWLDHLVLVLAVPVVGMAALVGYVTAHRGHWRDRSEAGRHERRRAWRGVVAAAAVTTVMWVPTLVAEATRSPGNLQLLFRSSGHERDVIASAGFGFRVMLDLLTHPPFWLRGSFDDPPFFNMPGAAVLQGSATPYAVAATLVCGALFVGLFVLAARRGDRRARWALIMALVALGVAVPTIYFTPTTFGIGAYLRPLWGVAAFTWFALGYGIVRSLPRPPTAALTATVTVVAVVVGAANLPASKRGYVPEPAVTSRVEAMRTAVLDHVDDVGPIAVSTRPDYDTQEYFGALVLLLKTHGVDFCVLAGSSHIDGIVDCGAAPRRIVKIRVTDNLVSAELDGPDTILAESFLAEAERERHAELDEVVMGWLGSGEDLELSPRGRQVVGAEGPAAEATVDGILRASDDPDTAFQRRADLRALLAIWVADPDLRDEPLFREQPLTMADFAEWQDLSNRNLQLVLTDDGVTRP